MKDYRILRDCFTNAKGLKKAKQRLLAFYFNLGYKKMTIVDYRKSNCDKYGDNYWFNMIGYL
uniref:Uncharacterized protein n=1 Tax=viral metagenome TaxID=1070528 RepID=A0A6H2A2I5_9ZZZZ